jgi:hypothetical protein
MNVWWWLASYLLTPICKSLLFLSLCFSSFCFTHPDSCLSSELHTWDPLTSPSPSPSPSVTITLSLQHQTSNSFYKWPVYPPRVFPCKARVCSLTLPPGGWVKGSTSCLCHRVWLPSLGCLRVRPRASGSCTWRSWTKRIDVRLF